MEPFEATLLVVEDDLSLRTLYARSFESASLNVLTTAGLLDARSILRSATPDAVLLDIGLEDDSGLRLLAELPEDTVVVVVTGKQGRELVLEVLSAGADDVVFKPFEVHELTSRVLGRLEARRRRACMLPSEGACPTLDPATGALHCTRRGESCQL